MDSTLFELGQLECRKVVDHAVLFKMKDDMTEEQEKAMLEALFTLQYQANGILYLSVGMNIPLPLTGNFTVDSLLRP